MFEGIASPIVQLIYNLLSPLLMIVGAAGTIYCVILGVKYAKAEEPQEREKAKSALKNALIGFILIFGLIFALQKLMPIMINWAQTNSGSGLPLN